MFCLHPYQHDINIHISTRIINISIDIHIDSRVNTRVNISLDRSVALRKPSPLWLYLYSKPVPRTRATLTTPPRAAAALRPGETVEVQE